MPTLKELEAYFIQYEVRQETIEHDGKSELTQKVYFVEVKNLVDAHGVEFLCPACFNKNAGNCGTHGVICFFRGKVPDSAEPGPGRWDVSGSNLDDLTLSPSVNLDLHTEEYYKQWPNACRWHGFVKNGSAT